MDSLGTEIAYLSIIEWPAAWSIEDRVHAVVAAAGVDPFLTRQRVGGQIPLIVSRIDPLVRAEVLSRLQESGVVAVAPTQGELRAIAPPSLVREMEIEDGAYRVMVWRTAEIAFFAASDITLIVRASPATVSREMNGDMGAPGLSMGGLGIDGGLGLEVPMDLDLQPKPTYTTRTQASHRIDWFTSDGRHFRIDGDKFAWGVLGAERRQGDAPNADRLALRLAEGAVAARVDTGFDRFNAPRSVLKPIHRSPPGTANHPLHEFYVSWVRFLSLGEQGRG